MKIKLDPNLVAMAADRRNDAQVRVDWEREERRFAENMIEELKAARVSRELDRNTIARLETSLRIWEQQWHDMRRDRDAAIDQLHETNERNRRRTYEANPRLRAENERLWRLVGDLRRQLQALEVTAVDNLEPLPSECYSISVDHDD